MNVILRLLVPAALLTAVLVVGGAAPASAELWKYKDKDGQIHYVDSKLKIPLQYRDQAEAIGGEAVNTYKAPRAPAEEPAAERAGGTEAPTRMTPTDNMGRTKYYWCAERVRLEKEIADLESRKEELNSLGAVTLGGNPFGGGPAGPTGPGGGVPAAGGFGGPKAIYEIQSELKQIDEALVSARAKLDELPNTVRKAGGVPGWVKGTSCPTNGPFYVVKERAPAGQEERFVESRMSELSARRAELKADLERYKKSKVETFGDYNPPIVGWNDYVERRIAGIQEELARIEQQLGGLEERAEELKEEQEAGSAPQR